MALGGEAGASILDILHLTLSPDTILNSIRRAEEAKAPEPQVVGIDEWAWRRGHRYGTIIVDLERHAVVDLLPDREVDPVVAWLQRHQQIKVIARDRSCIFAEAATKGAPQAMQVADRWHLLRNLADVLEESLVLHRAALRAAAIETPQSEAEQLDGAKPRHESSSGPLTPNRPRLADQQRIEESRQRQARLVEQYEAIRRLHAAGADVADIARRVGVSRRTVYHYRDLPEPPEPKCPTRSSRERLLAPYEPYLLQRWQEGCHNGMRLFREIQARGYAYGASNVARFVAQLRRDEAAGHPIRSTTVGLTSKSPRAPTTRRVTGLLLKCPDDLEAAEYIYLERLTTTNPALAAVYRFSQRFALMVRERQDDRLDAWLTEVEGCDIVALRRFAQGLRRDLAAVRAGLREVWSNGMTEGFVNKLKLVKRQMYGRAGFTLLRRRVLRSG
jgi:transposase